MSVIENARLRLREMGGDDACFILEVFTPDGGERRLFVFARGA